MGRIYFAIMPLIMLSVGSYLKARDSNTTGADDVVGTLLLTASPAIDGLQAGDDSMVRKALKATRDVIDGYLATPSADATTAGAATNS
jgi:hypothetical protein